MMEAVVPWWGIIPFAVMLLCIALMGSSYLSVG